VNSARADVSSPLASLAKLSAMVAAVALSCWISITYTRQPGSTSALWIASGILTGVLLTSPRGMWRGYMLAAFVGNACVLVALTDNHIASATHGHAWLLVFTHAAATVIEAMLVVLALMRYVGDVTDPSRIKRVGIVAITSTIGACALSALLIAIVRSEFGLASFGSAYATWFASHTLGMVIFATLTLVVRVMRWRLLGRAGHRLEFALAMLLTSAICIAVFSQSIYPLLFLVYPPLLLSTFRFRFAGAVSSTSLMALIAIVATLAGSGPFYFVEGASPTERILLLQLFIASGCLLVWPVAIALTERGRLSRNLHESERRYRILADYSHDLVVRMGADGAHRYTSPSAKELFGWNLDEFARAPWDLVHRDDMGPLRQTFAMLRMNGGSTTVMFRVRHKDGHFVWIEAHASLAPSIDGGEPEIIYSGRDVTYRVEAERALAENQRRLHAITDNLPAFVLQVDVNEVYTFANAPTYGGMGFGPSEIIGRTIRDVVGEMIYVEIKPQIDRALRGEVVSFEIERDIGGQHFHYQSTYVPEFDVDGAVQGFYVMTSDITQLKRTEQELSLLARYDNLTGLANRFHFNERVELALARQRRSTQPLALLYLDIDSFKQINDKFGHAIGDAVLREFAQRLKDSLRETDFAARLGGDEFVVLVEDVDAPEVPELIASKLIAAMQRGIVIGDIQIHVTTSIGIAFCRRIIASQDELLQIADATLYEAKAAGRNTCRTAVVEPAATSL
jgi:diguanylate cyclase (GGDEF)-like protein/PAS domain S-box-containing protein